MVSIASTQASGLSLSPIRHEFLLNPGDKVYGSVTLFNELNQDTVIELVVFDLQASGDKGQVTVGEVSPDKSIRSWVEPIESTILLPPKQPVEVPFSVIAPDNASPGGYAALLVVRPNESSSSIDSAGLGVQGALGAAIVVTVPGESLDQLTLERFSTTVEDLAVGKTINVHLTFQNTGTSHVTPAGFLRVRGWLGQEEKITLPQSVILSGSRRTITVPFTPVWPLGNFSVSTDVIYGQKNTPLVFASSFYMVPWKQVHYVLATFISLLIVYLLRKRLREAGRILFQKK